MTEPFDEFSKNYNLYSDKAISISGYDTKTLVEAKLKKLKTIYPFLEKKCFHFLDYGCGVGNLYSAVPKFFPQAMYTGVDSSKKSIQEAQSKFSNISDFQDLNSMQWKNNKYDLIFASGVFHHIPHKEHSSIIKYLSSLLNLNGKIVLWEHNPINPFTQKIVKECVFDRNAVLVHSKALEQHLKAASLSKVQIIYTTFFPKILSVLNNLDSFLGWLPLGGQYLVIGEKVD